MKRICRYKDCRLIYVFQGLWRTKSYWENWPCVYANLEKSKQMRKPKSQEYSSLSGYLTNVQKDTDTIKQTINENNINHKRSKFMEISSINHEGGKWGKGRGRGLKIGLTCAWILYWLTTYKLFGFYEGQQTHQRINLARMKQDKHSILSATVNARQILIGRYLRCLQITN